MFKKSVVLFFLLTASIQPTSSSPTVARTFIQTASKTAQKLTSSLSVARLFSLNSYFVKAALDTHLPVPNQSIFERVLEKLVPTACATAAETAQSNLKKEKRPHPFFNTTMLRNLLRRCVKEKLFVAKDVYGYTMLRVLSRSASFFNADIFIDPLHAKKHLNIASGIASCLEEIIARNIFRPLLMQQLSLDKPAADALSHWLAEDILHNYLRDGIKKVLASYAQKVTNEKDTQKKEP